MMLNQSAHKTLLAGTLQRIRSTVGRVAGCATITGGSYGSYAKQHDLLLDEDLTFGLTQDADVDIFGKILSMGEAGNVSFRCSMMQDITNEDTAACVMDSNPAVRAWPNNQMQPGFIFYPMIMPVTVGPFGMPAMWNGAVNVTPYIPICAPTPTLQDNDACARVASEFESDGSVSTHKDTCAGPVLDSATASDITPRSDLHRQSSSDESNTFWPATPTSTPPQSPRVGYQLGQNLYINTEIDAEDLLARVSSEDSSTQRAAVADIIEQAWTLATTAPGCRVIQAAIDVADPLQQAALVEEFRGHVVEAAGSPHANFVLQKCIVDMPPGRVRFFLSELRGHSISAAKNRSSCRVLQRLIEHFPSEQTDEMVAEVLRDTEKLCRHVFGNFVIQHILEHGTSEQQAAIVKVLSDDVVRLSKHKVASHVVKCAFMHCGPAEAQILANALTRDREVLADVARHNCGSFVMREMKRATGAGKHKSISH